MDRKKMEEEEYYMDTLDMRIVKMYDDVILPEYAHNGDACMDLRANNIASLKDDEGNDVDIPKDFKEITLYPGWTAVIGTGIKIKLPKGWGMNVIMRSGFSIKNGVVLLNSPGKIDCPYTGEYKLGIGKLGGGKVVIHKNDRIAQFEPIKQYRVNFEVVESFDNDENNERGENGLGSSGLK